MRRLWVRAGPLPGLVLLVLAGCSAFEFTPQRLSFHSTLQFDVIADEQMNSNFPVAVDLVIAYSPEAMQKLSQLDAAQWFAAPVKHLSQFPDYETQRVSWQWVPGSEIPRQELQYKLGSNGAVVFASYFSEGAHAFIMDELQDFKILLGPSDFQVTTVGRL